MGGEVGRRQRAEEAEQMRQGDDHVGTEQLDPRVRLRQFVREGRFNPDYRWIRVWCIYPTVGHLGHLTGRQPWLSALWGQ